MGEASYIISIEIHRDKFRRLIGLSQKAYIERILERFKMKNCSPIAAPIIKGDKFIESMSTKCIRKGANERHSLCFTCWELMYAQVCTRPDIAFVVGMLCRYQINPCLDHWKTGKKILRYLQGTKNFKLTYKYSNLVEVIGYLDSDLDRYKDTDKSISRYIFLLAGGVVSWRSIN
ncbi:secreted RxLR effector protein 161-like [Nicotiana tabacum]|uniref:Secreted RxLR effector protein 161-like n=1 Tax=Nicotiana tabacum TaxID=4097 RepID=A0AC58TPZ9_TOBAC